MGKEGLNPHYFINPSLFTYILFIIFGGYYVIGKLGGLFHTPTDFIISYTNDPSAFFILARLVTILFAILTIYYVYKIGKEILSDKAGLLGAFFLSVAFLHVRDSHFAVPDIPMNCLMVIALYQFILLFRNLQMKNAILCGLFIGLSCATKYTSVFLSLIILLLFLKKNTLPIKQGIKLIGTSYVFILIGFTIGCPYAFLDFPHFWYDIHQLSYFGQAGWFGVPQTQNGYLFYLDCLWWGIGWPMLVAGIIGFGLIIRKDRNMGLALIIFPVAYFLYMGGSRLQFERFTLPLIPFFAIATGITLALFIERIKSNGIAIVLVILIALISMISSLRADYLLTQMDTRTQAKDWMEGNLPKGSTIAIDGYGPIMHVMHPKLMQSINADSTSPNFSVFYLGRFGLAIYPLEFYQNKHCQYLVTSNYTYERYNLEKESYPKEVLFYQNLEKNAKVIKEFAPYIGKNQPPFRLSYTMGPSEYLFQFKQPGPLIKIYTLE